MLLASGLALRNCVFLGAAALLGVSAFYRTWLCKPEGNKCTPRSVSLLRAPIPRNCCHRGPSPALPVLSGFWPPVDTSPSGGWSTGNDQDGHRRCSFLSRAVASFDLVPMEILVLAAAMLTLGLAAHGIGWIACFYAGAAFAVAGMVGWHLAGETASALLRSGAER